MKKTITIIKLIGTIIVTIFLIILFLFFCILSVALFILGIACLLFGIGTLIYLVKDLIETYQTDYQHLVLFFSILLTFLQGFASLIIFAIVLCAISIIVALCTVLLYLTAFLASKLFEALGAIISYFLNTLEDLRFSNRAMDDTKTYQYNYSHYSRYFHQESHSNNDTKNHYENTHRQDYTYEDYEREDSYSNTSENNQEQTNNNDYNRQQNFEDSLQEARLFFGFQNEEISLTELKHRRNNLIKKWHPDAQASNSSNEMATKINTYYDLLKKYAT